MGVVPQLLPTMSALSRSLSSAMQGVQCFSLELVSYVIKNTLLNSPNFLVAIIFNSVMEKNNSNESYTLVVFIVNDYHKYTERCRTSKVIVDTVF